MFANKSNVPQILCIIFWESSRKKSNLKSSFKNVIKYSSEVDLMYDSAGKVDVKDDGVDEEDVVNNEDVEYGYRWD